MKVYVNFWNRIKIASGRYVTTSYKKPWVKIMMLVPSWIHQTNISTIIFTCHKSNLVSDFHHKPWQMHHHHQVGASSVQAGHNRRHRSRGKKNLPPNFTLHRVKNCQNQQNAPTSCTYTVADITRLGGSMHMWHVGRLHRRRYSWLINKHSVPKAAAKKTSTKTFGTDLGPVWFYGENGADDTATARMSAVTGFNLKIIKISSRFLLTSGWANPLAIAIPADFVDTVLDRFMDRLEI